MGLALGRGSANALFLNRYGIAHLPETFAVLGLALFVASLAYAAVADRIRPERLFAGMLLLLAGLLGLNWLLIVQTDLALAYPAYFVLFELMSELLALHITLYFAGNFDALQAKRLLPLALAGLQAGGMCGGALLAALAFSYGSQHGPAAWAVLALLAAVLILRRHARQGPSVFFRPPKKGGNELLRAIEQIRQGLRFVRASQLLRFASIGIFFMVVALYCASFASKAVLAAAFPGEAELSIVFGMLTFVAGAVTLLIQAFFTARLLQRFGVRAMNIVFPVTTIAVVVLLILAPGVAAALLVMLNRHIVMPAIRNPARGLLFDALPDWMQGRARALSLGLVLPLALVSTGAMLYFVAGPKPGLAVLLPALLAAGLFLLLSIRTNAAYVESMLLTLKEKLYLPETQAGEFGRGGDSRLIDELASGVMHDDEQVAVAYARVLSSGFPDRAAQVVLQRMQTASVRTRDTLLRLIGPHLPQQLVEQLGLEGIDAHETCTLRELHFGIAGPGAAHLIGQCLAAENPRLVACGIVGACQNADHELSRRGTEALGTLLRSSRETTILAGLEALCRVRADGYTDSLYGLLEHASPRVRRLCLQALAALGNADKSRLEPLLRGAYASHDHQVRVACVQCYALLEPAARNRLCLLALNDNHPAVAAAAMATLHHRNEDFDALLSEWLCDEAARPRAQEAALDYLKCHGLLSRLMPVVAEHKISVAEAMAQNLSILDGADRRQPAPGDAGALLRIVLRERIEQSVDLALAALEPVADSRRIGIVRASLRGRDRRQIARAIEALSHFRQPLVAVRLRDLLLFLNGSGRIRYQVFPDSAAALDWVRHSADAWLGQCAEFSLGDAAMAQDRL